MTADAERLARIYSAQARAYAETWSPIIGTAGRHLLETLLAPGSWASTVQPACWTWRARMASRWP